MAPKWHSFILTASYFSYLHSQSTFQKALKKLHRYYTFWINHLIFFSEILYGFNLPYLVPLQIDYYCRLDCLWKNKFKKEHEQFETMENVNRLLLENVLPAHVAAYFIGEKRNEVCLMSTMWRTGNWTSVTYNIMLTSTQKTVRFCTLCLLFVSQVLCKPKNLLSRWPQKNADF